MQQAYATTDLTLLERTYLGVLATGIVPARLAGDDSLRMDYITAVCQCIRDGAPRDTRIVEGGPAITPEFHAELTEAALALDEKGIISAGSPPADVLLAADPSLSRPRPPRVIDFDQHPRVHDRFLAQQCMEELFSNPEIYPFLMGKYQDSGDVWVRLTRQGYGKWR